VSKKQATGTQLGQWAEQVANRYLCEQGLHPIAHNYRCQLGEIDLIMQQGNTLVFIEVRYRKYSYFGDGLTSIAAQKQQRIIQTAIHYLSTHAEYVQSACRFDVVVLSGSQTCPQLLWIADAFRVE